MRKDIVKLDRETYEKLLTLRDDYIDYHRKSRDRYIDLYCDELKENKKMRSELGYYKALFDKEGDTEVIKCDGKLYRIVSKTHRMSEYEGDTLDFETELISEEE